MRGVGTRTAPIWLAVWGALAGCDDGAAPGTGALPDQALTDQAPALDGAVDAAPDAASDAARDATPDLPDLRPDGAAPECRQDVDCLDNQYCAEGLCRLGCRREPDSCPEGQACTPEHRCRLVCAADAPCETGLPGPCAAGRTVCDAPFEPARCVPEIEPGQPERCDGEDNDCDGRADEDWPTLGEACPAGEGLCAMLGVAICAADGAGVTCAAELRAPGVEACNGLDDDCDGQIDEDWPSLGAACEAGEGVCRAAGSLVCREGGAELRCDAPLGLPSAELCNGLDDDCDGAVDEDQGGGPLTEGCYEGPPATAGIGACAPGRRTCQAGAFGPCEGQVLPSPERCDGVDNDCNRLVDDREGLLLTEACYDGFPGTEGVGPCRGGTRTCVGGVYGPCRGQQLPFAEICDLVDNDCNGINDDIEGGCACVIGDRRDCYGGPEGTAGVGPCRGGAQDCVAPGVWGPCVGQVLPEVEVCSRRDDDCDGLRDNNVAGADQPCVRGQGICARDGITRCAVLGGLRCDAEFVPPQPERCNGLDDDCDGAVDEDYPVNRPCTSGRGACARPGVARCTPEEQIICDAEPGAPAPETCNGVDDDCDGRIDEAFDVGFACSVGQGICLREGFRICDGPGASLCDAVPGPPLRELCNGLDDDCDGEVDEDFGRGEACVAGLGVCATAGVVRCTPEGFATCSAVPPQGGVEVCNGLDDDCDGRVDEGLPADQPCLSPVPGRCRPGRLTCVAGARICLPELEPTDEICNGADDDCDGRIDERPPVICGLGVCQREIAACTDGADTVCDPLLGQQDGELCNGLDDDCDGVVDEQAVGDGAPCGRGVGGCERLSVGVCAGGALQCDAQPGQPVAETCNGVDDDCDGVIDEDSVAPGGACTVGVGVCGRPGVPACLQGALGCAGEAGPPADEICNGLDDDCDGTVDEGFGDQICGQGVCRRILANCAGGDLPACDPLLGAGPETCNGLDDDCDGTVDEDTPGTGLACVGGLGICRGDGLTACQGGRLGCAVPDLSRAETCNGLDDDCDGAVDEDPEDAGAACTAGLGVCGRLGRRICQDGALRCDAVPGPPAAAELCNGEDDDCDGDVDEDLGTVSCGLGLCQRDLPACVGGEPPFCAPLQGAIAEQCNGIDDDCDGAVDEDAPGVGVGCAVGIGACLAVAVRECVAGELVCLAQAGQPAAERCNGIDDDCDGSVDEDFGAGQRCQTGIGECRALGRVVCAADGSARCEAELLPGSPETCNGLDDDCDGRVDEDLADLGPCATGGVGVCGVGVLACDRGVPICGAGAAPSDEICDGLDNDCDGGVDEGQGELPCGEGACARVLPACRDGAPTLCDPLAGAGPETCNGVDDDCDGVVDEDPQDLGAPCDVGLGACARVGNLLCEGGQPVCDVAPGAPQLERCNQVDDDCDGRVDEDPIETASRCSAGLGVCRREAFFTCEAGVVRCPAQPGPPAGPEICNGLDDDCNGSVDEGFGAQLCGLGRCQRALANCDGGGAPACDPFLGAVPEACNGEDDDCDGRIDEDSPGVGEACGEGVGECRRDGQVRCVGGALRCDALPGAPGIERCDGRDNDCDGVTDEAPVDAQGPCTVGRGVCARDGQLACTLGRVSCSAQPGPAGVEFCNGLDDDCDGAVDEGLGVTACGFGICRREVPACEGGQPVICDPLAGARDETCNGADDDCDGQIDEELGQIECGRGVCARAVPRCLSGVINDCDPFEGAGPEVCDGLDNDCDGIIDELPIGDRGPCADGVGTCQAVGTQFCIAGALRCDAQPGEPEPERCDGRDNDCDGIIDEDVQDVGAVCTVGLGECTRQGITVCQDGFLVCPAVPGPPSPEICDELDNDCDNAIDEDGPDCNFNGFGDACDLASGREQDCNANGQPDSCDIAAGRSQDCNNDGIPDECNAWGCDYDVTPPTVELSTLVPATIAGGVLDIRVRARDNLNLASVRVERDGQPYPLDQDEIALIDFPDPGRATVRATARDAAGNETTAELSVRVLRPLGEPVERPGREPGRYGMCNPNHPCPVARVTTPRFEVAPGGSVILDAGPSTGAAAYRWRLRQSPAPAAIVEAFPGDPALGGPDDDPATPTAALSVPVAGRYVVELAVESPGGLESPSADCPSAAQVVIIARAAAPVRAEGAGCDPTGGRDRCAGDLVCRPFQVDDGLGTCGPQWITYGEREPDNGPGDLTALLEGPGRQAIGRLDPCGGDFRDLYGVLLERAGVFTVELTDLDGGCAGEARLTQLDPGRLESGGLAFALIEPLAQTTRGGPGRCPAIHMADGNPGLYVFAVEASRLDFAFDYALRVIERRPAGATCDPLGIDTRCIAPATCQDPQADGEGTCAVP